MSSIFTLVTGAAGIAFGFAYLRSPVWRLAVEVQDDALVVWNGLERRMSLPWSDVQKIVVDPERNNCFVDGGSPERSLLVPGPGATASYDIKGKGALIAEILAKVPASLVQDTADSCITDPKD